MAKKMTPGEIQAAKEAGKFFGKYFGIPLLIVIILFAIGTYTEPQEAPPNPPFVYVADTSHPWDTVPFTKYVPEKKTELQILEEINEQMFNAKR